MTGRGYCYLFFAFFSLFFCFSATPGPLDNLIVVEAENCVDGYGMPVIGPKGTTSKTVFFVSNPSASGNGFISSYPPPFRVYENLAQPSIAQTEIEIPVSGKWFVHVRYFVTPENIRKLLTSSKPPGHFRWFSPFKIIVGDSQFTCGKDQSPGEEFRWESFETNINAGRIAVKFVMEGLSGPDCIVLTQEPDYSPQPSDYEGPLWFRFKVSKAPDTQFYIFCRLQFNPYEFKGFLNLGWLFKDRIVTTQEEKSEILKNKENFLSPGNWSPWIKSVNPKRPYCFMQVMVMPSNMKLFPDASRAGFNNLEIMFQAATRPDEKFIIHQSTENTGTGRGLYILMPHESGLAGMRKWTKSFSEWADERLNLVKQSGAKPGEGPKKIQVFTDAMATVAKDIDAIIESCNIAGFNGFDLQQNIITETDLWKRIKESGFNWTVAHHLMLFNPDFKELEKRIEKGKSVQETINQYWYEMIKQRVEKIWGTRSEIRRQMLDLAILADEPNPQPHFLMINYIPVLKTCFHEFLKSNKLTPEFFGKKNWEEVEAIGIATRASGTIEKILKDFGVEIEWIQSGKNIEDEEIVRSTQIEDEKSADALKSRKENLQQVKIPIRRDLYGSTVEEKRLYYWTQKFRSYFTRQTYGAGAKVIKDMAENGFFNKEIKISPNFQAAPIMETRMWDGALNLFEWARSGTTNFLLCEDWINDPYRVAFGFSLLSAAARKNKQDSGYLIVVDRNFRRRYLTGLATGVKLFIDYSYGPLVTKGPAWSSILEYTKDWCEMLRWTARCEDDLVKTKMRKFDVALLIANSSEICSTFYSATNFETELVSRALGSRPFFRRAGIYSALLDANIPVEIISEEEIEEDNILDNYKVLYVVDTHVKESVQKKIKNWVLKGGTLWVDYLAMARNEYDSETTILNEISGLRSRTIPDLTKPSDTTGKIIKVLDTENLESVSFTGSLFKPDLKLSTGKILAVFEDSSPAIVYNRYGKGRSIFVGCSALTFSPYSAQCNYHPEFDKVRKIVSFAVQVSGAKRHCRVDVERINTFVRDGANQTIVFLINSTGKKQSVNINVEIPAKVQTAFDARGEKIDFVQNGNEISFSRDIAENDGEICVFRW